MPNLVLRVHGVGKLGNSTIPHIITLVPGSVSTVQLPIINDAMWPVAWRRVKVVPCLG